MDYLTLNDDDPTFVYFQKYVGDVARYSILNIYGKFYELTDTPVLSQIGLEMITYRFKTDFLIYHQVASNLFHKELHIYTIYIY